MPFDVRNSEEMYIFIPFYEDPILIHVTVIREELYDAAVQRTNAQKAQFTTLPLGAPGDSLSMNSICFDSRTTLSLA